MATSTTAYTLLPMRTSTQIKAEIEERFGFFPPFFEPALATPDVLENLWQQTLSAYANNPLPAIFKEKLFAYLSRYCSVPYCIVCHSCALRPLGMVGKDVLKLIAQPLPKTPQDLDTELEILSQQPIPLYKPDCDASNDLVSDSSVNQSLWRCSVFVFLQPSQAQECRAQLRQLLGDVMYAHLVAFLSYVKLCHQWVESYPELSFEADKRAQLHLAPLLQEEPSLAKFFQNYNTTFKEERLNREAELANQVIKLQQLSKRLQQSEERFRRAIVNAPFPMIIHAEDGEILQINQVWTELTGYTHEEIPTITEWTECAYGEDKEVVRAFIAGLYERNDRLEDGEFTITTKDGSRRIWSFSCAPLGTLPDGRRSLLSIAKDITQTKQVEAELRKAQERRFCAVFNQSFQFSGLLTPEGILLEANQTALDFGKFQAEDVVGHPFWETPWWTYSLEAQQRLQDAIARAAKGEFVRYEVEHPGFGDTTATLDFSIKPVKDENGNVILLICEGRNITEYKQIERALRESEAKLQAVLDHSTTV